MADSGLVKQTQVVDVGRQFVSVQLHGFIRRSTAGLMCES